MESFDNFLPVEYAKEIEDVLLGYNFPWFFWKEAIPPVLKKNNRVDKERFSNPTQLKHVFLIKDRHSNFYGLIEPMVEIFQNKTGYKVTKVHAAAALLQHPVGEVRTIVPHVDFDYTLNATSKLKTLVYYVTESDGDTTLYNEFVKDTPTMEVTPYLVAKQNVGSAIVFESNRFHSGSEPSTKLRVVVTIIMEVE